MTVIYKLDCAGCGRKIEKLARCKANKCYDCLRERKRKTALEYARAKKINVASQS